MLNQVRIT